MARKTPQTQPNPWDFFGQSELSKTVFNQFFELGSLNAKMAESLTTRHIEAANQMMETTLKQMEKLNAAKQPADFFQLQGELGKTQSDISAEMAQQMFEQMLEYSSEVNHWAEDQIEKIHK
ncbi:phasin family protein [Pelagibaculum spongiae]|uniref:Phasin domain-containing protein n=1 Tax=Pelagibaculum spongiae TaxID=2080658 RepID=A0A2V1H0I5_9GAMM|nr:phasin family protein [Pelagibaculum spongiae]PVZ68809.1 hypothetical protein DC094_11160 [Pelagibaculum spongiae]